MRHAYDYQQQSGPGFWREATALIPWRVGADPVYPDPLQQGAYDAGTSAGRAQAFPLGVALGGVGATVLLGTILYFNRGRLV